MVNQPATRRLLTEAAAAAGYQPKGSYQPAGSYLTTAAYTADKGAPSGLATLGADGKVLPAQLPAANVGTYTVGKAADTTRSTTGATNDTDLIVPGLAAGTYEFSLSVMYKPPTAAAVAVGHTLAVSAGGMYGGLVVAGYQYGTPVGRDQGGTVPAATWPQQNLTTAAVANFTTMTIYRGTLTLSAAATLSYQWAPNTASAVSLCAGSALRLVKVA